jgi:hypothetical protein
LGAHRRRPIEMRFSYLTKKTIKTQGTTGKSCRTLVRIRIPDALYGCRRMKNCGELVAGFGAVN